MTRCIAVLLAALFLSAPALAIDEIRLVTGDILLATVVDETAEGLVIEHPVLGRVTIPAEQVLQVNRDVVRPLTVAPEEPAPVEPPVEPPMDATETPIAAEPVEHDEEAVPELDPPKPWTWSVDLSWVSVTGNTNETSLRIGGRATRRVNDTRWTHDLTYYWKQTDSTTTDNKFTYLTRHDWLQTGKKLFWFVDGSFDYDQFESWEYRIAAHGGPGYHFIENEKMEFDGLLGIGVRKEFESLNDDWLLEAIIGLDYEWHVTERQHLVAFVNYFPILTDIEDFRTRSGVEWRYILETGLPLTLSLGVRHEYQNIVDPGKDRNDLRIWLGLGVTY